MREILFRGKVISADNDLDGKWIFGHLVVRPDHDDGIDKTFICESGHRFIRCLSKMPCTYKVDPNTVGQYTGLNDKNGKRIFEGDIIKAHSNAIGIIAFGNYEEGSGHYGYGWHFFYKMPDPRFVDYIVSFDDEWSDHEVIGNIYDNQELITEVEG